MTRVLLTAFEPFGGETVNPSLEALRRLGDTAWPDGVQVATQALPVVYGEALDVLRRAVSSYDADVVVATGQAGGRSDVTPERVAVNLDDAPAADNAGQAPLEAPVVPGGPAAYFSTLPVKAITEALRAAAIPASVSHTAGTYVCNHVFYGLMHLLATERPQTRGGFVHLPYAHEQVVGRADPRPPSLALATITEAVRLAVVTAVSTTADVSAVAGAVA
jgi:pyroglutamyl-peptidase